MVFLGYTEGTKAYRLYDPRGDKVLVSRDIVFDEKAAWDWSSPSTGEASGFTSTFVVEHLVIRGGGDAGEEVLTTPAIEPSTPRVVPSTPRWVPSTPGVVPTTPTVVLSGPAAMPTTLAKHGGRGSPIEFTSPPSHISEFVDAFHDGEKVWFYRLDNIV